MTWDDDPLQFGYVVSRLPNSDWWHLHFGRGRVPYHCKVLGRTTEVFACVQQFGPGVTARTPRFVLTLDGVHVDRPPDEFPIEFHWDKTLADAELFQKNIMPLLYESVHMQRAIAALIELYGVTSG